jgi:3-hydroxy-D-aspartate aldolase
MQALCDAAGVRLRAHGKMHKCSTLARMQIERGAVGLCCQTVGEAEAFVAGGIRDVLVTAPAPPWAAARIAALARPAQPSARSPTTRARSTGCRTRPSSAGVTLDLVVDIDLGQHRAGRLSARRSPWPAPPTPRRTCGSPVSSAISATCSTSATARRDAPPTRPPSPS